MAHVTALSPWVHGESLLGSADCGIFADRRMLWAPTRIPAALAWSARSARASCAGVKVKFWPPAASPNGSDTTTDGGFAAARTAPRRLCDDTDGEGGGGAVTASSAIRCSF